MEFCKICENMLYVNINQDSESSADEPKKNKLVYYCKCCNEEYDKSDTNHCVYHVSYELDQIKRENMVSKYIVNDPTLPKAHGIKCPNENCPSKKSNIIYIKNDDKNMKYIYVCVDCNKSGIEPNIW